MHLSTRPAVEEGVPSHVRSPGKQPRERGLHGCCVVHAQLSCPAFHQPIVQREQLHAHDGRCREAGRREVRQRHVQRPAAVGGAGDHGQDALADRGAEGLGARDHQRWPPPAHGAVREGEGHDHDVPAVKGHCRPRHQLRTPTRATLPRGHE